LLRLFGRAGMPAQAAQAASVLRQFLHRQGVGVPRVRVRCEAAPAPRGRSGKCDRVRAGAGLAALRAPPSGARSGTTCP
jgi:hypothetical protein